MSGLYGGNILFVDDDPEVLQALHGMLRPICSDWAMSFVESGAAALRALERTPYDVVVADTQMPGMTGVELLSKVKSLSPTTVRLLLLDADDKDLVVRLAGIAHQFLVKPCDADALRSAVRRAVAFESSVESDQVKRLVAQFERIPTIPAVYQELVEKLEQEHVTAQDIGVVIGKDMALSAKIIQLVNSAFFGLNQRVSSLAEAATFLGIETIKALVLSIHSFASFEGCKLPGLSLESLWAHSLEVGHLARQIIEMEYLPPSFAHESLIGGLLHDIGKVVLGANLPRDYEAAWKLSQESAAEIYEAEEKVFGVNHAEVGGYVVSLWGLPGRVVDAVAYHHHPEKSRATLLTPAIAVYLANAAVHRMTRGKRAQAEPSRLEFLTALDVTENLRHWIYGNI